jgi:predicted small secreted protein
MMKKISFIFVIALLLLTSCNFPGSQPAGDDIVATSVKQTLNASQPTPDFIGTQVAATLTQQAVAQGVPTQAPQATQAAADLTATPTSTLTLTVTPTVSLTPTPTPVDPKEGLGDPTWKDSLNSGSSFGLETAYDDGNSRFEVTGGSMLMRSYATNGYHGWHLTYPTPKNFYLEAQFATQNCSSSDEFGLVFRAPDYGSGTGYYIGLKCDGSLKITLRKSGTRTVLFDNIPNPEFVSGSGKTNIVGIKAEGNQIKIYTNNELVHEFSDSSLSDEGHFGVFISGYSGNLQMKMDEIAYWELP